MYTHTHTNTHTHKYTHTQTHTHIHTHTNTHTHTQTLISQGNGTEGKFFQKRKVFKEDFKELAGRMMERNRELVPDRCSLLRESVLILFHSVTLSITHSTAHTQNMDTNTLGRQ